MVVGTFFKDANSMYTPILTPLVLFSDGSEQLTVCAPAEAVTQLTTEPSLKSISRKKYLSRRDTILAQKKEYYLANKDRIDKQQADYHAKVKAVRNEKRRKAYLDAIKNPNTPEKKVARTWATRKHRANCTPELFDSLYLLQSGSCAICLSVFELLPSTHIQTDHDHATGHMRGLLCRSCNLGLGQFKDNPLFLSKAISYLENPPISIVGQS